MKQALRRCVPTPLLYQLGKCHDMEVIVHQLKRRGVPLRQMNALEVFARDGRWHTQHYANEVKHLECWELFEQFREPLQKNLPKATVKIANSFEEIRTTPNRFGLVVVDNPIFGDPKDTSTNVEHFDMFRDLFRVLEPSAVILLNVVPSATQEAMSSRPGLFSAEHLAARAAFYGVADARDVPPSAMAETYTKKAAEQGFNVDWYFPLPRTGSIVHYMAIHVSAR